MECSSRPVKAWQFPWQHEVKLPGSAWALSPRWLPWELAMVLKGQQPTPVLSSASPFSYFLSPAYPQLPGPAHLSYMRRFPKGLLYAGSVNPWKRDQGQPLETLQLFIKHLWGIFVSQKAFEQPGLQLNANARASGHKQRGWQGPRPSGVEVRGTS